MEAFGRLFDADLGAALPCRDRIENRQISQYLYMDRAEGRSSHDLQLAYYSSVTRIREFLI